ncbi:MAG: homoserine O-succinyltransferase [Alphaproteobacteria bacterium]|nr:homoserine O-succinyltransferase [Alphaproteobacteria bacterium]
MSAVAQYKFETALGGEQSQSARPRLSIGVFNNMPDAALRATERQFVTLLHAAAIGCDIRIHLSTLPSIQRSDAARARINARYTHAEDLKHLHLDALIVTGSTPYEEKLSEEPFWPEFRDLVDWAASRTVSTLWSCMAAHAAVLHLDGVPRRRLPRKLSGVFALDVPKSSWPLTGGAAHYVCPHSRYNDVSEDDLARAGYTVLGRSDEVGADMFAKQMPSRFVFLQGHPEYDGDTLMREYRRDLMQFMAGERSSAPDAPVNLFGPGGFDAASLARLAAAGATDQLTRRLDALEAAVPVIGPWSSHATQLFRAWVRMVLELKLQAAERQLSRVHA